MDPTQNQSGTPGPIFSAGPSPEQPPMAGTPSGLSPSPSQNTPFSNGGGDIILQPDYYNTKPRSKKPLIIGGIVAAVVVIALLILLPILSKKNNEVIDESKVKSAAYSYMNYLFFGEDTDTFKDATLLFSTYTIYADSMMTEYGDENRNAYFETLNKKLDDLAISYEETYKYDLDIEAIRAFYSDFALVANDPETELMTKYIENGVESLNAIEDTTTDSTNEAIIKYVKAINQLRKIFIDAIKNAYENGCYIYSEQNTALESISGCFQEIQFNNFGPYDETRGIMEDIEQSLSQSATDELNVLIEKFYYSEEQL